MAKAASAVIEHLVNEEIRRMVARAMADKAVLSTSECVANVKAAFPTSRMSTREIADKVLVVATAAGIALELGVPMKSMRRR
jgi:hypothetical protein